MYPFHILVDGEVVDTFNSRRFSLGVTIWKSYCNQHGATEDARLKGDNSPYTKVNPKTGTRVQLKLAFPKHAKT